MTHRSDAIPLSVSVVVCTYTSARWDDLLAAVASIRAQACAAHEIIVVVDHNPTLLARVRDALPDVRAVPNAGPQGLSGSRNCGLAVASGEVVAFLDDDAVAPVGWLRQLGAAYQHEDIVGVGGAARPVWATARPAWLPPEFDWVVGCTYLGMPERPAPVRNFLGCNMSFRRQVATRLGGFTSQLGRIADRPLGCEETDFCIRALQRSDQTVLLYVPTVAVSHRVPAHRATWRYFRARCYWEGRSKAQLARRVGRRRGLASERHYIEHTLPAGVARGVADGLLRHDGAGLSRSAAIIAGLLYTMTGYLVGTVIERTRPGGHGATTPSLEFTAAVAGMPRDANWGRQSEGPPEGLGAE